MKTIIVVALLFAQAPKYPWTPDMMGGVKTSTCTPDDMKAAILGISPFIMGDHATSQTLEYVTPSGQLRRQADAMDARENAEWHLLAVASCLQKAKK